MANNQNVRRDVLQALAILPLIGLGARAKLPQRPPGAQ